MARELSGLVTRNIPAVLLTLAVLASGCGGTTPPPQTGADLGKVRQDLLKARQRAVMAEVEAERLASEVEELKRQLIVAKEQAATAPAAQPSAPVADGMQGVDLSGRIEEVELEEPPPPPQITAPVGTAVDDGTPPQAIYDRAYSFFHDKRYAEAEREFVRFLELNPQSHLADNAQFWVGECRYARGDFSSALAAFSATVDRYPHGNKVADALLKAGKSLESLGQRQQALSTYDELVTRFPGSAAALAAERLLKDLQP